MLSSEASKYVVKNYKTSNTYICSKCGRLTPYIMSIISVFRINVMALGEVDPDGACNQLLQKTV